MNKPNVLGKHHTRRTKAFSLIELITVVAIMTIMMGLIVSTHMGIRPAGSRQGAISQLMGGLEEARMSAIEKSTTVYFAVAGLDTADPDKRLRSYMLFRDQTAEEKALSGNAKTVANGGPAVPITRWESLPSGFYFDPAKLETMASKVDVIGGLPAGVSSVNAVKFGSLGQLQEAAATNAPGLVMVEGVLDPANNTITPTGNGDIKIEISRLTGRVHFDESQDTPTP